MSQPFRIKNDFEIAGDLTAESGARFGSAVVFDPDAVAYIQAVEAADGQQLELAVRFALDDFVKGCKSDGIWDAIKASCIMAGARTLAGALVPLKGAAPTNFNFVSGDYDRKTGLIGDGATKYLDSNRANNADPQNSNHNAIWASVAGALGSQRLIGGNSSTYATGDNSIPIGSSGSAYFLRSRSSSPAQVTAVPQTGLNAISRSGSGSFDYLLGSLAGNLSQASQSPSATSVRVFTGGSTAGENPTDARLSFYSIGESLDLAALDARVSALMTALDAAII
jgi:hypothetical protein